ncbi:hypothetical protein Bca4012_052190 [Brassica carinata]
MAKWNSIVLIMMVVIAIVVTVEAKENKHRIKCFHKCTKVCKPHDGNCHALCKEKCRGSKPPHIQEDPHPSP